MFVFKRGALCVRDSFPTYLVSQLQTYRHLLYVGVCHAHVVFLFSGETIRDGLGTLTFGLLHWCGAILGHGRPSESSRVLSCLNSFSLRSVHVPKPV